MVSEWWNSPFINQALIHTTIATIYCLPCVCAGLKKWVEVGNSGVFRPEMLLPMGLPEDVSVIAWGLSLERLAHTTCSCIAYELVTDGGCIRFSLFMIHLEFALSLPILWICRVFLSLLSLSPLCFFNLSFASAHSPQTNNDQVWHQEH